MLLPCQRQVPALVIHLAWTLCLLTMVSPSAAQLSATISVERSDAGNGRFLYEYEIVNDPASEVSINAFVLDVGNGADLASLEGPENWTLDYSPEEISFEYAAVSGGPQFDIDVGSSATFSFTSPLESDLLDYFLANLNPDGTDNGALVGAIAGPAVVAPELFGDYNLSGEVDVADYNIWRDLFGAFVVRFSTADGNGNGLIDAADYNVWRDNFGNTVGPLASVPEPSAFALMVVAALAALRRRRG